MKKKFFSYGVLIAAVVFTSCNNDGDSSTTTDSGTSTMSDTGTMSTGTSMMSGDTSTTGTMATTANNVGETDRKFMMEAASGGMMEVEAGQLAGQVASSDRVKAFGNMMVQDHTNANNELKGLASAKSVMLPDSMMAKHKAHITMLKKKTGKDFDKAYMTMMVADHKEDVNKFQTASNNATDADLKGFATKTLPVLRGHLDSAQAINSMKK